MQHISRHGDGSLLVGVVVVVVVIVFRWVAVGNTLPLRLCQVVVVQMREMCDVTCTNSKLAYSVTGSR